MLLSQNSTPNVNSAITPVHIAEHDLGLLKGCPVFVGLANSKLTLLCAGVRQLSCLVPSVLSRLSESSLGCRGEALTVALMQGNTLPML